MKDRKRTTNQQNRKLSRRDFMAGTAAAAVAISTTAPLSAGQETAKPGSKRQFKLKYAPGFGMFQNHAGGSPIDQLRFASNQGFTAFFDNDIMRRSSQQQEAIAKEMSRLGMTLGPFVAYADFGTKSFVTRDKAIREMLVKKMKQAVESAKRANAKWILVVPGRYDDKLQWDYQTANVIENARYCAEVLEPSGRVMVLEPLNAWRDHPGLFLTRIPQAYQICRAVNSPSCKIVNDLYHQQITEGNLIPNIDMAWEQIAGFHLGDNPGRQEPTTGEINFKNIFKHIHKKGFQGVLCMEHGNSKPGKEGEKAVIEAYRACDGF